MAAPVALSGAACVGPGSSPLRTSTATPTVNMQLRMMNLFSFHGAALVMTRRSEGN